MFVHVYWKVDYYYYQCLYMSNGRLIIINVCTCLMEIIINVCTCLMEG